MTYSTGVNMHPRRYVVAAALVLGLANLMITEARAQEADTLPRDSFRWSVGPYVGALLINENELEDIDMTADASVIFGARVTYQFRSDNP
jgi:hypothetical protein